MRNRYIDLLRAAAIVRVVVYHATGGAILTIVFPAMSVMFALGGALMAASLDRHGVAAVGRRLRRLLPSLWLLAAVFVPAMLLTGLAPDWRLLFWLAPLQDPPANTWGALALSVIWYLRDFLWFVLLSPLALPLFRRWPVPTLLIPYGVLAIAQFGVTLPPVVADIGLYFGAWLLGFAHHDGRLRRVAWRVLLPAVAGLLVAGAAWFLTHPGPRGFDLNDIRLGNALWSTGFVLLLLRLAPAGGQGRVAAAVAWLERRDWIRRVVTLLNARALTIYLWHMPFVVALVALAGRYGWPLFDKPGLLARLPVVAAGVAVAVVLFGWVEDVAALRSRRSLRSRGALNSWRSLRSRGALNSWRSLRSRGVPALQAPPSPCGGRPLRGVLLGLQATPAGTRGRVEVGSARSSVQTAARRRAESVMVGASGQLP
jgi:peptidoglycan/LPS O-acetylase OafA/YrhL